MKDTHTDPPTVAHQHLTLLELTDALDAQRLLDLPDIEPLLVCQLSPTQLLFLPESSSTLEGLLKAHHIPFSKDGQP